MKGVYGQSRPKSPRMNALTRLPSTKTNKNAKGYPSWCYSSHQMDQHVLDIQRNILFLQIVHPPWCTSAQNCSEAPTSPWMRQVPSNGLYKAFPQASPGLACPPGVSVKSSSSPSSSESTSPAVNSKVTGRPLGSGARGRSWVWSRSRILLSPTRTAYTSCPTFRTITPGTYQDACRCLDRTSAPPTRCLGEHTSGPFPA